MGWYGIGWDGWVQGNGWEFFVGVKMGIIDFEGGRGSEVITTNIALTENKGHHQFHDILHQ